MTQLARSLRFRSLLVAVVTVLATLLPAGMAQANGGQPAQLTLMTRNLYLGTGLDNTVFVPDVQSLVNAVSLDWANVLATDFRTRARALAAEVQRARPDVLGLQEVTLWRDQTPADSIVAGNPPTLVTKPITPNARHVVFDFLTILRSALAARGLAYTPVVTSTNADAEAPRLGPRGYVDLRITDRDVILVRSDQVWRVPNRDHALYGTQLTIPNPVTGGVTFTRGWTSIDYRYGPSSKVRIFNTHLEVPLPPPNTQAPFQPQYAQGLEALAIIGASPYPVIAVGDYNSAADGSGTPTYAALVGSGLHDAWTTAHGSDPGLTCCQAELLDNATGQETSRIDLILSSATWPVDRVNRTGSTPFRASPPPLWGSDHFGVTARFTLS
jgi:endonuclease/exonuclease/phosphatase family metal-dependent hydrolase